MVRYRKFVTPLAIIAAGVLAYMEIPAIQPAPGSAALAVATVLFWVLSIAVVVLMFTGRHAAGASVVEVEGPAFSRYLFSNTQAGLFWLPIRIFLGVEWFDAGWHKLTGGGWTDGGSSILGYWTNAVKVPAAGQGSAPITFDWYRSFLQFLIDNHLQAFMGWLITLGELAVGVGLLLGILVGVASFFGVTMNMSYLLAGSTSVNPIMFALAVGLMLGWKVAGYYGLDRWLLPRLGVPWRAKVVTAPSGS